MKRRKILIISDAWKPQINGVVRTYEHLAPALERLGHEVRIIGPGHFRWQLPLPGYSEIRLALFCYGKLSFIIEEFAPTSVHIATEGPLGWAARRYCLKHGLRFTTAYHTQFPAYIARRVGKYLPALAAPVEKLVDRALRHFHDSAAGIVITTQSLAQELENRAYRAPLYPMIRGVPTDLFSPGPSPLYTNLPRPIALFVGRVAIEKNIEAFLSLPWAGSKIVVGDGPSFDILKNKYPDAIFAGVRTGSDLAAHYRAADLFVFPSRTDTFGIVLLEALACGLPVAGYDVTGPRDIITKPFLGALHKEDLGLATHQALTLTDQKQARHDYVREHYSWDTAARQFLDILNATNS